VSIPSSVTSIGRRTFFNCTKLDIAIIENCAGITFGSSPFDSTPACVYPACAGSGLSTCSSGLPSLTPTLTPTITV
jgi:hypothetical protein